MLRPKLLVVDTNVWIDYLLGKEPFCTEIVQLFGVASDKGVSLLYAPTTLKDVFYIVPRQLRRESPSKDAVPEEQSRARIAWACVEAITRIATAAPQSMAECNLAWMLRHKHADLEDNLIIAAAETCNADYVITYDRRLIEDFAPVCITPSRATDLLTTFLSDNPDQDAGTTA